MATYVPDAHPESATVDGRTTYGGSSSWATTHDTGTGTAVDDGDTAIQIACSNSGGVYSINRGYLYFNTADIPDDASIDAVTLTLTGSGSGADNDNLSVVLTSANSTSATALATGDYNKSNFGATEYASRLDLGSWNATGSNVFTFNADGRAAVSKTGITKIGVRLSGDVDDSAPSGANTINFYAADNGSNKPTLSVTFTSASLSPSRSPSVSPSVSPSASLSPSRSPSVSPSSSPSQSPSASSSPSASPSISPSSSPSASPSKSPSLSPSASPSYSPSPSPDYYTWQTKNSTTWSNQSKNTTTSTFPAKTTTSYTFKEKTWTHGG